VWRIFKKRPPRLMKPGFKKFLQSWIINTLAVLVTVYVLPGIHFTDDNLLTPFVTSLVLGILNAFVRPVMMFLALPLLFLTLGLFLLVINALLLCVVDLLLPQFDIDGFGSAFLGALLIGFISILLNTLTGTGASRVEFRKGNPPDRPNDKGGNGPVIDV
jgi:putative membrane protein